MGLLSIFLAMMIQHELIVREEAQINCPLNKPTF